MFHFHISLYLEKFHHNWNDKRNIIMFWQHSICTFPHQLLSNQSEKFGGDTLLTGQEALLLIRKMMDGWTDCALKVFNRHRGEDGSNYPDHEEMIKMNEVRSSCSFFLLQFYNTLFVFHT